MSGVIEYRDDDIRDTGFCPHCGAHLREVQPSGRAFCEKHGWVFVNFGRTPEEEDDAPLARRR